MKKCRESKEYESTPLHATHNYWRKFLNATFSPGLGSSGRKCIRLYCPNPSPLKKYYNYTVCENLHTILYMIQILTSRARPYSEVPLGKQGYGRIFDLKLSKYAATIPFYVPSPTCFSEFMHPRKWQLKWLCTRLCSQICLQLAGAGNCMPADIFNLFP